MIFEMLENVGLEPLNFDNRIELSNASKNFPRVGFSGGFSGVGKDTEDGLGFPICDFEHGESIDNRFFDLNGIDLEEPGALILQQSL